MMVMVTHKRMEKPSMVRAQHGMVVQLNSNTTQIANATQTISNALNVI